jgi:hypothetical protein
MSSSKLETDEERIYKLKDGMREFCRMQVRQQMNEEYEKNME